MHAVAPLRQVRGLVRFLTGFRIYPDHLMERVALTRTRLAHSHCRTDVVDLDCGAHADVPGIILETIFEAAADATHWRLALSRIAEWVGAIGAMYFLLDADIPAPRVSAIYSSGFAPAAERSYSERSSLIDPHVRLGMNTPPQKWFLSQDHFDSDFISSDPFFQEVMNPLGIRWVAGSRLWNVERDIACLALQKPTDCAGFTDTERSRLSALTPHLGRATRLHRKLDSLALKAEMGIEAMNALGTGMAMLDARSHVLFANTSAEHLFKQRATFRFSSSRLALCHSDSHGALRKAIAGACRNSSAAIQLCDRDATPVISAVVLPLPASSEWNAARQRPLALLAMNPLKSAPSIPRHWLDQLFGLTPTESRVAAWLVSGRTIDDYAQHYGVSLETARSQLKAVLSKAGMSRQAELVATLARLPVQHAGT